MIEEVPEVVYSAVNMDVFSKTRRGGEPNSKLTKALTLNIKNSCRKNKNKEKGLHSKKWNPSAKKKSEPKFK